MEWFEFAIGFSMMLVTGLAMFYAGFDRGWISHQKQIEEMRRISRDIENTLAVEQYPPSDLRRLELDRE